VAAVKFVSAKLIEAFAGTGQNHYAGPGWNRDAAAQQQQR